MLHVHIHVEGKILSLLFGNSEEKMDGKKSFMVKYQTKNGGWESSSMEFPLTMKIEDAMVKILQEHFGEKDYGVAQEKLKIWTLWANGNWVRKSLWQQPIGENVLMTESTRLVVFGNEKWIEDMKMNVAPAKITIQQNFAKMIFMLAHAENCFQAGERKSPEERRRRQIKLGPVPESPESVDLAIILYKLSVQFKTMSTQAAVLGSKLLDDGPSNEMKIPDFIEFQNLYQNFMEGLRFLSAAFQFCSSMGVPLRLEPPRKLFLTTHIELLKKLLTE